MHIAKDDLPVKLSAPGAVAQQLPDFGDATGYGAISGEHLTLAAGLDIGPLLRGLEGDVCHAPHWGHVLQGSVVVTYRDGTEETCRAGELVYWPAGHTLRVIEDAELVLFSPQVEHTAVFDHMAAQLAGSGS